MFVSKDNKQEYIEIDDSVRQGDYKYTYSDNSNTALKSEQADLVVGAVEKFAQVIPLNIQEIFLWYFEQKGVDNPERFLIQQTSAPLEGEVSEGQRGVNNLVNPSPLTPLPQVARGTENVGQTMPDNNPENQLSQTLLQSLPPQNLPLQESNQSTGISAESILQLISIFGKLKGLKNKSKKNNFLTMLLESIK